MHPSMKKDKLGRCPKCGMMLVKHEKNIDHGAHSGHVMADPSKMSMWGKFKMSMSSIIVAVNAVMLKRVEKDLTADY